MTDSTARSRATDSAEMQPDGCQWWPNCGHVPGYADWGRDRPVSSAARDDERRQTLAFAIAGLADAMLGRRPEGITVTPGRLDTAALLVGSGADPIAVWERLITGADL